MFWTLSWSAGRIVPLKLVLSAFLGFLSQCGRTGVRWSKHAYSRTLSSFPGIIGFFRVFEFLSHSVWGEGCESQNIHIANLCSLEILRQKTCEKNTRKWFGMNVRVNPWSTEKNSNVLLETQEINCEKGTLFSAIIAFLRLVVSYSLLGHLKEKDSIFGFTVKGVSSCVPTNQRGLRNKIVVSETQEINSEKGTLFTAIIAFLGLVVSYSLIGGLKKEGSILVSQLKGFPHLYQQSMVRRGNSNVVSETRELNGKKGPLRPGWTAYFKWLIVWRKKVAFWFHGKRGFLTHCWGFSLLRACTLSES